MKLQKLYRAMFGEATSVQVPGGSPTDRRGFGGGDGSAPPTVGTWAWIKISDPERPEDDEVVVGRYSDDGWEVAGDNQVFGHGSDPGTGIETTIIQKLEPPVKGSVGSGRMSS